jgi:hypothetical protein
MWLQVDFPRVVVLDKLMITTLLLCRTSQLGSLDVGYIPLLVVKDFRGCYVDYRSKNSHVLS